MVASTVLLFLAVPGVRRELAPRLISALVAIQVENEALAEVGPVEIDAGQAFTIHAVLVAENRKGETIYYTEAPALLIDGVRVAPDRLQRWAGREMRILWFTVEGFRPFLEPSSLQDVETFQWQESFRPDWGRGWVAVGSVSPSNDNLARTSEVGAELPFGTARYHVRIEEYRHSGDSTPIARYRSPGAAELVDNPASLGGVVSRLPGGLASVSEVFGMVHFETGAESSPELLQEFRTLYARGLGFSRLLVLNRVLADHDLTLPEVRWTTVEIQEGHEWARVGTGDLLRSGERVVVLFEDRGVPGRLDYQDLCFDFFENAAVRPLGEVFKSGGVVGWADLSAVGVGEGDG